MSARTKKYERLPPEPGIPFTGFDFAEIDSRKPVAKKIGDFINYCMQDARSPAARIILGEWGEGKSEAYIRYIQREVKSRDAISYDISAPAIIEIYKNPLKNEKIRVLASPSVQLLTAIFWAILDDMKVRGEKERNIPLIDDYHDQVQWLEDILKAHSKKYSKIFIFVDQVEELILEFDVLKWFLIGLRETLDGKFFSISEKGRYPGSIFFFLSCTPDAYHRMLVDPRISEIIGGQQRRIGSIELLPIGRKEGLKFFHDLLRYSYLERMPEYLPFRSAGVLNSLFTATRGNLGAMVSLFTKVMRSIQSVHDGMEIVDGGYITELLANESVAIYGGTSSCIDKDLLVYIESEIRAKKLHDASLKMLLTLLGELKPFSTEEIGNRLRLSASEIFSDRNALNQALGEIVPRAIVKVFPVKENFNFKDIVEKLAALRMVAVSDTGEKIVQFDNYRESTRDLEDRVTYGEFENSKLAYKVFLPLDIETFQAVFEGISNETCSKLKRPFEALVEQNRPYLVASSSIVDRLYPIPVSPWLQFVRNREIRQRIWRDVRAGFSEYFRKTMNLAFVSLLKRLEAFDKLELKSNVSENLLYIDLHDKASNVWIRILLLASASVSDKEIDTAEKLARQLTPRPNLILILHIDDLSPQITQKISDLKWQALPLKLHPTYAKNLLAIHIALDKFAEHVDQAVMQDALRTLASQMQIVDRISEWIDLGKKNGSIIVDLKKDFANNDDELVDTLKFYVNFLGKNMMPKEALNSNFDKLLRFVPFGLKPGLAADIETVEQLEKITLDLKENGFICLISNKNVQVVFHPVEKRILEILRDKKQISFESLEEFFVISAGAKRILQKVFLALLAYKGLVDLTENKVMLNDLKSYEMKVEGDYEAYRSVADSLLTKSRDYAHIYVTKQRDERLILLSDFNETMQMLHESAQRGSENVRLQSLSLIQLLVRHFDSSLRPKFEASTERRNQIVTSVDSKFRQIKERFLNVVQSYNRLYVDANLGVDNIKEYAGIEEQKNEIVDFSNKPLQAKELAELSTKYRLSRDTFDHRHYRSTEFLFNLKISALESLVKNFTEEADERLRIVDNVSRLLGSISKKENTLNSKLFTFRPDEKCKITCALLGNMRTGYSPIEKKVTTVLQQSKSAIKLSEIEEDLKPKEAEYSEKEAILSPILDAISDLQKSEGRFIIDCGKLSVLIGAFCSNADLDIYKDCKNNLSGRMRYWKAEYERQLEQAEKMKIQAKNIRAIHNKLDDGLDEFGRLQESMDKTWTAYKQDLSQRMDDLEEIFSVLKKQGLSIDETKHKLLTKRIADLKDTAERIKPWEGDMKLSLLEKEALSMQTEASKILPISSEEAFILQCIVEKKRTLNKDWIGIEELEKAVKKKSKEMDVRKAVDGLLKKRIVAPGISFVAK